MAQRRHAASLQASQRNRPPKEHAMSVSHPVTASVRGDAAVSSVEIPQLRIRGILAVWAAAALPMAVLAWLVAPMLADRFAHDRHGVAVRPRCDPRRS